MRRRTIVVLAAVAGVILVAVLVYFLRPTPAQHVVRDAPAVPVPTASATRAAEDLLSKLDDGAYDAVFEEMSGRFKDGTERTHFVTSMGAVRATLGKVRERTLKGESAADRNPEGRVGPFRVLQYMTTFDRGPRLEVLVLVAEGDTWRFYSYNVAQAP